MVTVDMSSVNATSAKANRATGTSRQSSDGADSAGFAQILEGLGSEAEDTTVATVASTEPGRAPVIDAKEESAADQEGLSAELLALCGVPMVAPVQMPVVAPELSATTAGSVPVLISTSATPAATATAPVSTVLTAQSIPVLRETVANDDLSLNQAPPVVAAETASITQAKQDVGGSVTTAAAVLTPFDMQWLRSNARIAPNKVADAASLSTAIATPADAVASDVSKSLPEVTSVSPEQQNNFQTLLAQATPMMAMLSAQLHDEQQDVAATDAQADALIIAQVDAQIDVMGTSGQVQLQPVGTQLASDASALDASIRQPLQAHVGTHQWATELGNKLTLLASKDTQSATLYMTPADLGPVQVRIDMNKDQASVWFTAEHAETRSALEQSLPRLREMFTAQGMSLTDAGVFGDRSRQQQQPEANRTSNRFLSTQPMSDDSLADTSTMRSISLGLLDAYA